MKQSRAFFCAVDLMDSDILAIGERQMTLVKINQFLLRRVF